MKKAKKFFKISSIVFASLISIVIVLFVANNIYQKQEHHISDIEEIKFMFNELEDIPIVDGDCYWQADVMFMGGALESHASGKIKVSQEYYNKILQKYEWTERRGFPTSSEIVREKAHSDFVTGILKPYYFSKDYCNDIGLVMCVSKEDNTIYFFFYSGLLDL